MKLSTSTKIILWVSLIALYASGLFFVLLNRLGKIQGEFGLEPNPWQSPALQSHGAIGLFFFAVLGHLFAVHIKPGFKQRRRKYTGILLFGTLLVLCLSAPLLYYVGNEQLRTVVSDTHTYLGLFLIIPIAAHLLSRK